jgi:hypothetical protein
MDLCYRRSDVCSNASGQYRNPRIDLRPGGAVIYADIYVPEVGIWQQTGVVLRLDGSGRQFEVAGVDMGGTLYALPSGDLGTRLAEVAQTGNTILSQLALQAGGGRYVLQQVRIDDNALTLVMR